MSARPATAAAAGPAAHERRHRAVQSHFTGPRSKAGRAAAAAAKGQSTAGGSDGRPAWCFFAPTSNRGVSIEGTSLKRGQSNYLIQVAKEENGYGIPSPKRDAAYYWGTEHAEAANRAEPDPTDRVPTQDLYTAAERREWAATQRHKCAYARKNEASLPVRRERDMSRKTLDNHYRQELMGKKNETLCRGTVAAGRPLMSALMQGAFFNPPKPVTLRPADYVAANRRGVRAASAHVRQCRHHGMIN